MKDFQTAYTEFYNRFDAFMTRYYSSGIQAVPQKLSEIVAEHPLDEPEERETNLFLWIMKAALHFTGDPRMIVQTVKQIGSILAAKNADYGNSAREPSPFFGDALSPADCILVRIGDKIARADHLSDGAERQVADESCADTVKDFIGYTILLYVTLMIDGAPLHLEPAQEGRAAQAALYVSRPMTYRELFEMVKNGDFEIYLPADIESE